MPETPKHWGAAEVKRIGRLLRLASAKPLLRVAYQMIRLGGWLLSCWANGEGLAMQDKPAAMVATTVIAMICIFILGPLRY